MQEAVRALGTTLEKGTTTPIVIAGLTSIDGIEITAETVDVTTLDSEGGYREFIQGFKDAGEVPIEGYLNPTVGKGQIELQTALDSGDVEDYVIKFPVALNAKWTFKGMVTSFKAGGAELDGVIPFSATIKVSGKPTLGTLTV